MIDDDQLTHLTWQTTASMKGKELECFCSPGDFYDRSKEIDFATPIYIDANLGNGIRGENVAKDIFNSGFKAVFLCTGYDPEDFPEMPWIKGIFSKDPQI